jgi:hypothetical protein
MDQPVKYPRGWTLSHAVLLAAVVAVAVFNGTKLSPFYDPVAYMMHLNLRGYPYMTARLLYDTATFPIAVLTLMLAGVPAALYERIRGLHTSSVVSLVIWLITAVLLTWPTIKRAFVGTDGF